MSLDPKQNMDGFRVSPPPFVAGTGDRERAAQSSGGRVSLQPGVQIIVSFFRNEGLVAPLVRSLADCADELRRLDATVVAINDSPGYQPLTEALEAASARWGTAVPFEVVNNVANLGFVRSSNLGLARATAAGCDAVLLNSDTIVFPGAIGEMARVARLDPMIGFVSPRSNNATIASLPADGRCRHQPPADAFRAFEQLSAHLPDYHFTPTAIGFCLFIRHAMLREFGLLDEVFGAGYNEENDLILRANRCGYRAVLANHAFVYHHGETSFGLAGRQACEARNAQLLAERYPEYPRAVNAYVTGPLHRAEKRLSSLLPDAAGRYDLLFDFSDIGSYHNGTIEAAVALLREFAAAETGRFNLFVIMHARHARFHGLDSIVGVQVLPVETDRDFAVGLRIGQPFTLESYERLDRLAVRTAWFMLDTITWDCLGLVNGDLDWIWRQVFEHADAVIYNSEFTRGQFARRFAAAPGVRHLVSPHSLDPAEYLPAGRRPGRQGEHILVVGNKFPHKHVGPTVDAIVAALPAARIECVGLERHPHPLVRCHAGGFVSADAMESLYERASVVVFPSHYEGFGFPILKALAYRKPIIARDSDLTRDLKVALGDDPNVILCGATADMVARLRDAPPSWREGVRPGKRYGWRESREEISALLWKLVEAPDPYSPLVRRLSERYPANCQSSDASVPVNDPPHPTLPPVMRRIRAVVMRMPVVRAVSRPLWRLIWRLWQPFLDA